METVNRPPGLATVREQIAAACGECGRDPASVTLVAISKTFGATHVRVGTAIFGARPQNG